MTDAITYCENHPTRETGLRCNRCDKLICPSCAVSMATGYRCKQCIREQGKVFNTAKSYDYALALVVSIVLSLIGYLIVTMTGFFFFIFFISPAAGKVIASVVQNVTKRRRSKALFRTAVAGILIGGLGPAVLLALLGLDLYGLLQSVIYSGMAAFTAYYSLTGFSLK